MSKETSYSSAGGEFPVKIVHNRLLMDGIGQGTIAPIHLQLNPTNRCDLKCRFCSCAKRDRNLEVPIDVMTDSLRTFQGLGCQAVTITGGGEPLLYPQFTKMVQAIVGDFGMKAGLVTNGRHLRDYDPTTWKTLTWIRISVSDETEVRGFLDKIRPCISDQTDWSFSYVVTSNPNPDGLAACIRFAHENRFTHVRVVSDILNSDVKLPDIRKKIRGIGEDSDIVIWQDRSTYALGTAHCLISLLKPVLGADGGIYPCCGSQYARAGETRDYPPSMKMATIFDRDAPIEILWQDQLAFDGSKCNKCYYMHYNDLLAKLLDKPNHLEFV